LPDGLIGAIANVEAVVQRRSAQGDCRFEPQGYPAQILASSTIVLEDADPRADDFSDLIPRWAEGIDVLLPFTAADRPEGYLGLVAEVLDALAPEAAPITVSFTAPGQPAVPAGPFVAVGDLPPASASPRVRFDTGRVAVADRAGHVLLDVGGYEAGAVLQVVTAGGQDGLWIKPLGTDGMLPSPPRLAIDRGDVAFVDRSGVALAMSTERDTLLRISYPDRESWLTVADRYRAWVIGSLWVLGSIAFLVVLQQMRRRRAAKSE
jgi:hypothetical protein